MFPLAGLKLYGAIGVVAVIIALSGYACVQHNRVQAKDERIYALEMAAEAWEHKVADQQANIERLERAIEEQNGMIDSMATLGAVAEERQRVIDELHGRLARAEDDLRVISAKYREMREQAVGLDTCQTYEMVLRSLAGGVGP